MEPILILLATINLILFAAFVGLIVLGMIVYAIRVLARRLKAQQAWWDAHYPPISDAEFLAKCTPGTGL
jgi:hypothetical protein